MVKFTLRRNDSDAIGRVIFTIRLDSFANNELRVIVSVIVCSKCDVILPI